MKVAAGTSRPAVPSHTQLRDICRWPVPLTIAVATPSLQSHKQQMPQRDMWYLNRKVMSTVLTDILLTQLFCWVFSHVGGTQGTDNLSHQLGQQIRT